MRKVLKLDILIMANSPQLNLSNSIGLMRKPMTKCTEIGINRNICIRN